jgi:hypothetical protein
MVIKSSPLLLLLLIIADGLCAQVKEGAIYTDKSAEIEIRFVDNAFKIEERHLLNKIFYSNFDRYSRESVIFSDLSPMIELDAQTLTPKGSGFKKTKVSTIETKDLVQPGIFYGGNKRMDFVFPNLSAGAIGRLAYAKEIKDVHLITPFFFDENIPVEKSEFSVIFPKNVTVKYMVFGNLKGQVHFSERQLDNTVKYSWVLEDIPPFETAKKSPGFTYHATHVIIWIDSYQLNGRKNPVGSDVADLYSWFQSLIKKIPSGGNYNLLNQQVATLVAHAETKEKAAKTIFQWVQKNIKYIAFEQGMAGFIPREASDVYNKRYGDCKDMANLLRYMLNQAGIESYLTWIGTRSKPYNYEMLPLTIINNHMICCVKMETGFVFLDATDPFLDFSSPSSMIQGKEGLIGIGEKEFKLATIPTRKKEENQRIDSIFISLEKDGVKGNVVSHLKGYKREDLERERYKAEINNKPSYMRDFYQIGDNNVQIESVSLAGLDNPDLDARVQFNFFQPGYFKNSGDKFYLNMVMNKSLPGEMVQSDTRNQLIEADYLFENKIITQFTLPNGYRIASIPPDFEQHWNEFGVSSKYHINGNVVTLEQELYSNYLYIDKPLFQQWNKFIEAAANVNRQIITLSKQ